MTPTPAETPAPADTQSTPGDDADGGDTDVDWQAFVPTDTADHLATMDRAARQSGCGVPWQLLAAIARVESDFGRNMATSSAGAIGYGQFLPSSWQAFGNDGNVYDYRAALPAIATYLCQSGLATNPRAALFAYNHAEWYVDLVLDLAVRYDRMAPGAPTPDVLTVDPASDPSIPLHYAPGRDLRLQARARSTEGAATWLAVPWQGRPARSAISVVTLETTSVTMLRAAFGLTGAPPESSASSQLAAAAPAPASAEDTGPGGPLASLIERAWAGGLLADPRPLGDAWSIAEIRQRIDQGQAVAALLNPHQLPGHDPSQAEAGTDQPIVVIGVTPDGLVYSDPSFSSSLGYGLELSDADFLAAWQGASTPLQALAIGLRPEPPSRDDYFLEPRPSPPVNRLTAALPSPTSTMQPLFATEPNPPRDELIAATVDPTETPVVQADVVLPVDDALPKISPVEDDPDGSWLILAGAALLLCAALGLRRWRSRHLP